jgi:hypothetical protein
LFTYGLNSHGHLGIGGIQSHTKDENPGFHMTPTLIRPLLESGGNKAMNCMASVDHFLLVIATEGRHLHKLPMSPAMMWHIWNMVPPPSPELLHLHQDYPPMMMMKMQSDQMEMN